MPRLPEDQYRHPHTGELHDAQTRLTLAVQGCDLRGAGRALKDGASATASLVFEALIADPLLMTDAPSPAQTDKALEHERRRLVRRLIRAGADLTQPVAVPHLQSARAEDVRYMQVGTLAYDPNLLPYKPSGASDVTTRADIVMQTLLQKPDWQPDHASLFKNIVMPTAREEAAPRRAQADTIDTINHNIASRLHNRTGIDPLAKKLLGQLPPDRLKVWNNPKKIDTAKMPSPTEAMRALSRLQFGHDLELFRNLERSFFKPS